MFALIDHGVGNLRSVYKALTSIGADVQLTDDPNTILAAVKVILPGVGAFKDAMQGLQNRGLVEVISQVYQRETPILGICVGMQMLFEVGEEMGEHGGLGFLRGRVKLFPNNNIKIPQTGWNQLFPTRESPLLVDVEPGSYAYFNHSYYCEPSEPQDTLANTKYGINYTSVVQYKNLYGVQFHPEKSQQVGLRILKNFVERC